MIKKIEPIRVASIRDEVQTPPEQGRLWCELEPILEAQKVRPSGPCLTLYYDDEYREIEWDVEVCEPIAVEVKETGRMHVKSLAAVEMMACTVHKGSFVNIPQAYKAILKWIDDNGYHITGPCREVYLHTTDDVSQTDPNTITEIQYPVEK